MDQSIQELVATSLTEFGVPTPTNFIQTMLMKDRYFVGHKFRYDGGHAILPADGNTLELYNEQGQLLKTVGVEAAREAAA